MRNTMKTKRQLFYTDSLKIGKIDLYALMISLKLKIWVKSIWESEKDFEKERYQKKHLKQQEPWKQHLL